MTIEGIEFKMFSHKRVGNGGGFVILELKNLSSGSVVYAHSHYRVDIPFSMGNNSPKSAVESAMWKAVEKAGMRLSRTQRGMEESAKCLLDGKVVTMITEEIEQ